MTAILDRSQPAPTIVVELETAPGSDEFVVDHRLRADTVEQRSDDRFSTATISVRLDNNFDFLDARHRYHGDLRIVVRTEAADASQRLMLFDGYPLSQSSTREGGPHRATDEYRLIAVSVYQRWAIDPRGWIQGRRMRNAAILDGLTSDPGKFATRTAVATALPCVFNINTRPNRAAEPIIVRDADGKPRRIFLFTHDDDPMALPWSLLDALRHVLWFHHTPEGPVSIRALLDATESAAGLDPRCTAPYVPPSGLVARLLASADDLNCEAVNLVEAVALIADRASVHATCVVDNIDGHAKSRLALWTPHSGATRSINIAWGGRYADGSPRYDTGLIPANEVTADNQARRIEVLWDHSRLINAPIVVGDVKRWEMTVPLVPGWTPETDLDNVAPEDRDAAKAEALTPDVIDFLGDLVEQIDWYRKYHRSGDLFADHRDVARYWVLNEDGAFDAATFNRNAPFDDYAPFDFAASAGNDATSPGKWTRRPRPMRETITRDLDGSPLGVFVEVSYDGGANWHPPVGPVSVDRTRAAIRFDVINPTSMIPPGGDWNIVNMWYAIIDQQFRVRATAVFESDERLRIEHAPTQSLTPTFRRNTELVFSPGLYRFASRATAINVLAGGTLAANEMDDRTAAAAATRRIAEAHETGTIEATVRIPWIDNDFTVGDRITGLGGRDVALSGVARESTVSDVCHNVLSKLYVLSGGRLETRLELVRSPRMD